MLLQIVNHQFINILESISAILCISLRLGKLYHLSNQTKKEGHNKIQPRAIKEKGSNTQIASTLIQAAAAKN